MLVWNYCKTVIGILIKSLVLILCILGAAKADFRGMPKLYGTSYGLLQCPATIGENSKVDAFEGQSGSSGCSAVPLTKMYVPASGMYSVRLYMSDFKTGETVDNVTTSSVSVESTQDLKATMFDVTSPSKISSTMSQSRSYLACYALVDESGKEYTLVPYENSSECNGGVPLPPTPVINTSCTINNNNPLNVDLGTLERSEIPTSAGTTNTKSVSVPVDCTGGVDVNVNMKLNYTSIDIGGKSVIKSSANGLGVSVIYNSQVLAPTDTTPVTLNTGSNTLNLSFGAVRDPNVDEKNVPTGAFTASAVLVMTQL